MLFQITTSVLAILLGGTKVKAAGRQQQLSLPPGVWTSRGYGYALFVQGNGTNQEITLLDETAISCIPNDEVLDYLGGFDLLSDDLAVLDFGSSVTYYFDRSDSFQSGCANGLTNTILDESYIPDTLETYDIFVETFDEHYAFFELRGVDWKTASTQIRTTLATNSSEEELFVALVSLVAPLQDGHVTIEITEEDAYEHPSALFQRFYQEYDDIIASGSTDYEDPDQYSIVQLARWISNVAVNYMENNELKGDFFGGLVYGKFASGSNVGYIQMIGLSYEDNDMTLDDYEAQLNVVFEELGSCDSIVIDHRFNTGGEDSAALLLASYFASERTLAYTQTAVNGDSFTEKQEVYINPGPESLRFHGKVVLIVSEEDASAGKTFALSMKQLPQTTIIGKNTNGILSDKLVKFLPNGWTFSVSNEIRKAPDGTIYEKVGIPPHILAAGDVLPLEERETGIDSWLELALDTISSMETSAPTISPSRSPTGKPTGIRATAAPTETPTSAPSDTATEIPSGTNKATALGSMSISLLLVGGAMAMAM